MSDMKKVLEHFYRTHPNLLLKEGALEEEKRPKEEKEAVVSQTTSDFN